MLRVGFLVAVSSLLAGCIAGNAHPGPRANPALRDELLTLEARDDAARSAADPERVRQVDAANLARLKALVGRYGWPSRDLVGTDASRAAWTIALHADSDAAFQRQCLDQLRSAVSRGEASPAAAAYLEDRILINQGLPQRYGTQFTSDNGTPKPYPIEDPANLEKRRAQVGLPSMAEYTQRVLDALAQARAAAPAGK